MVEAMKSKGVYRNVALSSLLFLFLALPAGQVAATNSTGSELATSSVDTFSPTDISKFEVSCAKGGPCQVGDRGPGGGIVFYVSETPFNAPGTKCQTNCLYLEYATTGWLAQKQNPPQRDCGSWEIIQRPFTGVWEDPYCLLLKNNSFKGKTGRTIGSGYGNTTKLLAAAGIGSGPAVVRNYRGGGKSDWFVPSIDELVILNSTIRKWMDMEEAGHVFEIDPGVTVWGFSDEMLSSTATPSGNFYIHSAWTEISEIPAPAPGQIRPVRAFGISNQNSATKNTDNQALIISGRCVPASVPYVNVKKPWNLESKKCDRAKSTALGEFSEYKYSVEVKKNLSSNRKDVLLNAHLNSFLKSVNLSAGWDKPWAFCEKIDSSVYYECNFTITRVNTVKKIYQTADVFIKMFGSGQQFACACAMEATVKVANGAWE
jgi:hypothetical protein